MTGAEHYRAAEQLLTRITTRLDNGLVPQDNDDTIYADVAQVHATLALVDATRLNQGALTGEQITAAISRGGSLISRRIEEL